MTSEAMLPPCCSGLGQRLVSDPMGAARSLSSFKPRRCARIIKIVSFDVSWRFLSMGMGQDVKTYAFH